MNFYKWIDLRSSKWIEIYNYYDKVKRNSCVLTCGWNKKKSEMNWLSQSTQKSTMYDSPNWYMPETKCHMELNGTWHK